MFFGFQRCFFHLCVILSDAKRSRTRGGASLRALRERGGRRPPRDLYKRFLLACLEISNIVLGFSYAPPHRRFRSHARALFTLTRVNKVRLRTGLLSHFSTIITLLRSAQNDAYRGAACCSRLSRVVKGADPYRVWWYQSLTLNSAFCTLHSAFCTLHSPALCILHSIRASRRPIFVFSHKSKKFSKKSCRATILVLKYMYNFLETGGLYYARKRSSRLHGAHHHRRAG